MTLAAMLLLVAIGFWQAVLARWPEWAAALLLRRCWPFILDCRCTRPSA